MTIQETVIRESLERAESERNQIKAILNANPYSEMIQLEMDAIEKAKALSLGRQYDKALVVIQEAQQKKSSLLEIARQQQDSLNLIRRMVKLDSEIGDLSIQLYRIEEAAKRRTTYANGHS